MNKYEYKCNRCLIIEKEWILYSIKPSESVTCPKCGGLALRLPPQKLEADVFEGFQKEKDKFNEKQNN